MNNTKKILLLMLTLLLFKGCSCGNWWNMMSATTDESNTLIIEGVKEIRNRTLVLSPGTKVIFKTKEIPVGLMNPRYEGGSLIIGNNASLIAKGTPDNPVIFSSLDDSSGGALFFENGCNTENSILKYCLFEKNILLHLFLSSVEESIEISRCKFNYSDIVLINGSPKIVYNTFISSKSPLVQFPDGLIAPRIEFNLIENCFDGFYIYNGMFSTLINNNNFNHINGYAVYFYNHKLSKPLVIRNNYIKNCNGLSGIDKDGSQSYNVIHSNYRTNLVSGAGCGW